MRARCDWCGMEVEVLASGKCLLGHPLSLPPEGLAGDSAEVSGAAGSIVAGGSTESPIPARQIAEQTVAEGLTDIAPRRSRTRAPASKPLPREVAPSERVSTRSIRTAPTPPRTPRTRLTPETSESLAAVAPVAPVASKPVAGEPLRSRTADASAGPGAHAAAAGTESASPRVSRPWAPVEPDGPSGPVRSSVPREAAAAGAYDAATKGDLGSPSARRSGRPDPVEAALRDVLAEHDQAGPTPGPSPEPVATSATMIPQPRRRLSFGRRRDTAESPPESRRRPPSEPFGSATPQAGSIFETSEPAEPMQNQPAPSQTSPPTSPPGSEAGSEPAQPAKTSSKAGSRAGSKAGRKTEPEPAAPTASRTRARAQVAPDTEPPPGKREPKPKVVGYAPAAVAAAVEPVPEPAPRSLQPRRLPRPAPPVADITAGGPGSRSSRSSPAAGGSRGSSTAGAASAATAGVGATTGSTRVIDGEIARGALEDFVVSRHARPERLERTGMFSPRNSVAWGLAIAATFAAGVAALYWTPSRAGEQQTPPTRRSILLTSVPGSYVVRADPDTESRTRAELAASRAKPRQLAAASIVDDHGTIVALYEAIVFSNDVAGSRRDLEDFISLFAEGAGVTGEAFAERPLGRRTVWSALLPQGQAVLMFRGPEVVIVITDASGAEGDRLADAILTARGL